MFKVRNFLWKIAKKIFIKRNQLEISGIRCKTMIRMFKGYNISIKVQNSLVWSSGNFAKFINGCWAGHVWCLLTNAFAFSFKIAATCFTMIVLSTKFDTGWLSADARLMIIILGLFCSIVTSSNGLSYFSVNFHFKTLWQLLPFQRSHSWSK